MAGMITHAQLALDHLAHAVERPELGFITVADRTLQQQPCNLLPLCRIQLRRPARHRLGRKRLGASTPQGLAPAAHRRTRHQKCPGHGSGLQALLQHRHGHTPTLFQRRRIPFRPHRGLLSKRSTIRRLNGICHITFTKSSKSRKNRSTMFSQEAPVGVK